MSLNRNQHQGLYGESFVRVLASAAGLTVAKADLDVTGDDYTICRKGNHGGTRHPKIDVQVKSWSRRSAVHHDGHWHYSMRPGHFNELAGTDFPLPRYLILVIVPDQRSEYAETRPDSLLVRFAAYSMSLQDRERVDPNSTAKVPVHVPVGNLLTVDKLRDLMVPPPAWRRES
ncbi:uncharacterized protein DUF4365 [Herbihabitans rhizosphaerae]|uniref:Uncharacterized protein DUF4365 n=1 Tax=Herbihabitans rhizosphaerae TaxID=1872711 RepID=A0A4Q7KDB1_9PSEU|nr:DUF4365 domain-containing protein [Herbihabitans rhizosphaerae]RZS32194.1 uncharacterized protein DUF4365 [Herbihabitans rhizosphaerae]